MLRINKHGYWENIESKAHQSHDLKLAFFLVEFFQREKVRSVGDFGCGLGTYVKTFRQNKIKAFGFDGNPCTPELTNGVCEVFDLAEPKEFEERFDWIICLRVGELIKKKYEDIFINNLHNNNNSGIILSWAKKGQGGEGHVNEQDNEYIKQKICDMGYMNDITTEQYLRENASAWWFKETIMVFRKIF